MIENKKKIEFVVSNFHDLENELLDCINYIPFIDQNLKTISPRFVPIILESCSLIESIFKDTLGKGNFNFKAYSNLVDDGLELNNTISILLTTPIKYLNPFQNWKNKTPTWWNVYNKLKHNRLNNYHLVTYDITVSAIVALHQLISKHRGFTNHIIKLSWIPADNEFLGELLSARMVGENCIPLHITPCESKLFVSPLGGNFVTKDGDDYHIDGTCGFSNRVQNMITLDEFGL